MRIVVALARFAIIVGVVVLAVVRFLAIDANSHSNSDTLRPWLIELALIALVAALLWIAMSRISAAASRRERQ